MPDDFLIDIETYSPVDLKKFGPYAYVEHDDFRILMGGHTDGVEPVEVAEDDVLDVLGDVVRDSSVRKVAHNAAFERICFSAALGLPVGKYLPPEQWHCTQVTAAEYGWPQKLEHLSTALGAPAKDSAGTALINWFCKPDRNGRRRLPQDHPDKWDQFVEYCAQDVRALAAIHLDLGEMPPAERAVYIADQHINDRGLPVDLSLARHGVAAAGDNARVQGAELVRLTGVDNPNSTVQLAKSPLLIPLNLPNFQAETLEDRLAGDELTSDQRRALELRLELGLVASKKFNTALGAANSDARLRGGFAFHGAHTGRWAGRRVQPHNLPRAALKPELVNAAIFDLKQGWGAEPYTLKALVRPMFKGPFTVVDYAAIEARVVAWLAGETWALKAFRAGRDIYVETAERMGGLTRAQGKVAVLALGYQGAINSLRVMGAQGTDEELLFLVRQWRQANPHIVAFWYEFDKRFRLGGAMGDHVTVETVDRDRLVHLPSGRTIYYRGCGWRTVKDPRTGRPKRRASFRNPAKHGFRQDTYGGKLTENVTQAVARDILAEGLVRLDDAGYRVVGHVHDEVIVEGRDIEGVTALMCQVPTWAGGLPIDGEGFTCDRYRKG